MGSKAPSWGQHSDNNPDRNKGGVFNGKKMAEAKAAASAGYDKAKAAAVVGASKVKSGASLGFEWIKNQYQKRTSK